MNIASIVLDGFSLVLSKKSRLYQSNFNTIMDEEKKEGEETTEATQTTPEAAPATEGQA